MRLKSPASQFFTQPFIKEKHKSSASLAFVRGIHRGPVNSPHKWPVARKNFPFDDVIMTHSGPITTMDQEAHFIWSYLSIALHELFQNFICNSHEVLMNFVWIEYELYITLSCAHHVYKTINSYEFRMKPSCNLYEMHMKLCSSYEVCMKLTYFCTMFTTSSYEVHIKLTWNLTWNSYEHMQMISYAFHIK